MADRRVAREQVLAYRVAAHHLDERRPATDLARVAGACGIQDTPPGNADVALAARVDLEGPAAAAAIESKRLVATWSLRGAPHLLPPDDLPVFTLGARPSDGTITALWGQPEHALVDVEKRMVAALGTRARTKGELSAAVTEKVSAELAPYCRGCDVHHPNESVFRGAPLLGRIVLTSTSPVVLTRARTWLGSDATGDVESLRTELLLRYLRCYAPTTATHFAAWAGITGADAKARWTAVADALVPVHAGRRAFVLEDDLDALEHAVPAPGVRFLPSKDVFLQARDRDLLLPEKAHRSAVFTMLGGPGVVLVDGAPVATWRGAAKGTRYDVTVTPFGRLAAATKKAATDEAQRVARVRGHDSAAVNFA